MKLKIMNNKELARLKWMYKYELFQKAKGINVIAGIDEAGRGPLAGPVVASAVILPDLLSNSDYEQWEGINDSKKLSAKKRERLYNRIIEYPKAYVGIGIVSERKIDEINILRATQMAMRIALNNLPVIPQFVLVDGMTIPDVKIRQQKIINGDCLSLSIASASIIAKVTRDNIMRDYHQKYPQYGFNRHKGYGTKEHFRLLKQYGYCRIHRKSFRPVSLMREIDYPESV